MKDYETNITRFGNNSLHVLNNTVAGVINGHSRVPDAFVDEICTLGFLKQTTVNGYTAPDGMVTKCYPKILPGDLMLIAYAPSMPISNASVVRSTDIFFGESCIGFH